MAIFGIKVFKSKEEKQKYREHEGYNLAAGELLRGKSVEAVQQYTECSRHFGDYDAFDSGYDQAIKDFKNTERLREIWYTVDLNPEKSKGIKILETKIKLIQTKQE